MVESITPRDGCYNLLAEIVLVGRKLGAGGREPIMGTGTTLLDLRVPLAREQSGEGTITEIYLSSNPVLGLDPPQGRSETLHAWVHGFVGKSTPKMSHHVGHDVLKGLSKRRLPHGRSHDFTELVAGKKCCLRPCRGGNYHIGHDVHTVRATVGAPCLNEPLNDSIVVVVR
jgi:hypothetical protein